MAELHRPTHCLQGVVRQGAGRGRLPVALERLDNTFAAGANISIGKARTAVLFECPSEAVWDYCRPGAAAPALEQSNGGLAPFAGGIPLTVILGLLCLLLSDLSSLKGLGPVGALGIAGAMLAALTLLPAVLMLVFLGSLTDRFSPRLVAAGSLLGLACACVAMYFSTSLRSWDNQSKGVRAFGICFAQASKVSFGRMREGTSEPSRKRSQASTACAAFSP